MKKTKASQVEIFRLHLNKMHMQHALSEGEPPCKNDTFMGTTSGHWGTFVP